MSRKDQPVSGADQLVARARARLRRLEPWEAAAALDQWAVLVDVRTAAQRAAEGEIPVALVVERNVLEWRLDPTGPDRLPMAHQDLQVIVICDDGQTSSLAAAALQDVGVHRATDVVGGYQAWRGAGLPTNGATASAGEHDLGPAASGFASGLPLGERFDGVPWTPAANGAPLVDGCISTLACGLERETTAGDHVVVFGRVTEAGLGSGAEGPLLYFRGALVDGCAAPAPAAG